MLFELRRILAYSDMGHICYAFHIIGKLFVGTLYRHLLLSPQISRVSSPDWRKLISVGNAVVGF